MKIVCRKIMGALEPVDEVGRDALKKVKTGDLVTVEFKRARNIDHHRKYWALVSIIWDNQPHIRDEAGNDTLRYPTTEDLHAAIKIAAGYRTRVELPDGTLGFIPGSIAFHKMDQTEFDEFYDRVCDLVAKYFLPGVEKDALKAEVAEMIGAGFEAHAR